MTQHADDSPQMDATDPARDFAISVVRRLRGAGFQALWAGGCVRDELRGLKPKDFDVASTATPEQVIDLFGSRNTFAVGASFGVVVVLGPGKSAGQIEVALEEIEQHLAESPLDAEGLRVHAAILARFHECRKVHPKSQQNDRRLQQVFRKLPFELRKRITDRKRHHKSQRQRHRCRAPRRKDEDDYQDE